MDVRYGNYVVPAPDLSELPAEVQHMLEHGRVQDKERIIDVVRTTPGANGSVLRLNSNYKACVSMHFHCIELDLKASMC